MLVDDTTTNCDSLVDKSMNTQEQISSIQVKVSWTRELHKHKFLAENFVFNNLENNMTKGYICNLLQDTKILLKFGNGLLFS